MDVKRLMDVKKLTNEFLNKLIMEQLMKSIE